MCVCVCLCVFCFSSLQCSRWFEHVLGVCVAMAVCHMFWLRGLQVQFHWSSCQLTNTAAGSDWRWGNSMDCFYQTGSPCLLSQYMLYIQPIVVYEIWTFLSHIVVLIMFDHCLVSVISCIKVIELHLHQKLIFISLLLSDCCLVMSDWNSTSGGESCISHNSEWVIISEDRHCFQRKGSPCTTRENGVISWYWRWSGARAGDATKQLAWFMCV